MTALGILHYTNWRTHMVPEGVRAKAWHHYACYFIQLMYSQCTGVC